MTMTNRERILKTATYDFLVDLNSNIQDGGFACVIECLTDEYQISTGRERCITVEHDCDECIQKWLNEEEKSR